MRYLSLVGTQMMGTLGPLLALRKELDACPEACLFHTAHAMQKAEDLKKCLCGEYGFPDESVRLISLPERELKEGQPQVHEIVAGMVEKPDQTWFNLNGGLKFQIVASVLSMPPGVRLLYSEESGVHVASIGSDGNITRSDKTLPNPDVKGILKLQGLSDEPVTGVDRHVLWAKVRGLLAAKGVRLPKDRSEAVPFGGMLFELSWFQNGMTYLLAAISSHDFKDDPERKKKRAAVRLILDRALHREETGDLFSRHLLVLTDDSFIEERLRLESHGKIEPILTHPLDKAADRLKAVFENSKPDVLAGPPLAPWSADDRFESALVSCLGTNIMPSLIAIHSHQPEHVILCYTPGNAMLEGIRERMLEHPEWLGVKKVTFWPTDLAGFGILGLPQPVAGRLEVNVSPGGKGMGVMLAWWAKGKGVPIYSLDNSRNRLARLPHAGSDDGDPVRALVSPTVEHFLLLCGIGIQETGKDVQSLAGESDRWRCVLAVLREAMEQADRILLKKMFLSSGPDNTIRLPHSSIKTANKTIRFKTGGYPEVRENKEKGFWIESLLGFALAGVKADDVRVGLRTAWSEANRMYVESINGKCSHMDDFDVVARFGPDIYAISCKTSDESGSVIAESRGMASVLGRFAIPLVCVMGHDGEPELRNGVYIFGWRTLADPGALRELLRMAKRNRQTTKQVA